MIEKRYKTKLEFYDIEDGLEVPKKDFEKYYKTIQTKIYYEENIQQAKNVAYSYIEVVKIIRKIGRKTGHYQGELFE